MKEDSTFLLIESKGWVVDWAHPSFEICTDKRRGSTYGKITYTVTKDLGHRQSFPHEKEAGRMVCGVFCRRDPSADKAYKDDNKQDGGWHSLKSCLPHRQREDRGCEQLHKGTEKKRFRLPGLRLFRIPHLGADA